MDVLERRQQLCAADFVPIPLFGKIPPNKRWQDTVVVTQEMLTMWQRTWPDAANTGLLTRLMPTLDIDILNEDAASAVEDLVRERFEEKGHLLVRIGKPPKRAIPFRTQEPFAKFVTNLLAPNGNQEKIEFLADGAQVAAFGIHPDTGKPFRWHGGTPGKIRHGELPYIREVEARQLVDDAVGILVTQFGYTRAKDRKRRKATNGHAASEDKSGAGSEDWNVLIEAILEGRALHDNLRDLAAKMVRSGMKGGAVVNYLRALMANSKAPHDDRWKQRYDDIRRLVAGAEALVQEKDPKSKHDQPAATVVTPSTIDATLKKFDDWLVLQDNTPVLAVLGAVAANHLDGDAVWLGLIAPPSSAKTEILNALSLLPDVVQAATVTPAGLLSGSPKKQQAAGARGGLLRQIGDFGIVVLKDLGSLISQHTETRAETLAALREIYDGSWTRILGSDGGKSLSWKGKVGVIFAATGVIDSHYAVIGSMGDRFLFSRLNPVKKGQFNRALKHRGATTAAMRKELAEAVRDLFAGRKPTPRPISDMEAERIDGVIRFVVRLRGAVARDFRSREIEAIYGAEGTARIGLALERLLAGLDVIGVERERALGVVTSVAMDSVPPLRRDAYACVCRYRKVETADVAIELGLPTVSTRRILEELAAYGLVTRHSQGAGKADLWDSGDWEAEP